jgi:hypothetical protein
LISAFRTILTLSQTTPPPRPHQEETKVNDQNGSHARHARVRHTATGALAALAAVGAIAGTAALAAQQHARPHGHAAAATGSTNRSTTKTPTSPVPGKAHAPQPAPQAFLTDAHQLVSDGTITATEGQVLASEIQAGQVDTATLASKGFTPTQLQAVQQALSNTKQGLGRGALPSGGKNTRPEPDAKTHRHS